MAFWLIPEPAAKEFFIALMGDLARRFDAPFFEPHVTLQAAAVEEEAARRVLREVAAAADESIELEIEEVRFSQQFTRTLFVQFSPAPAAQALSRALGAALGRANENDFAPHLSLLYQTLPEEVKRTCAAGIRLPFTSVKFDCVEVIATPAEIATPADVELWRRVGECPLGTSAGGRGAGVGEGRAVRSR